jgi:hypothetical protein
MHVCLTTHAGLEKWMLRYFDKSRQLRTSRVDFVLNPELEHGNGFFRAGVGVY